MKLKSLTITDWQAISHVKVDAHRPIILFAGVNEAGKSSIVDALRMVCMAEPVRVGLKKEYPELVRQGAQRAVIEIVTDRFSGGVAITSAGGHTDTLQGKDMPVGLEYVLDAQRFASMAPDERRSFLYGLMGVQITPEMIAKRLIERGCNEAKVEIIAPPFHSGFEGAHKEAVRHVSDSRGAWKAVTGETYGEKKAPLWRAPSATFSGDDAAELTKLDKEIVDLDAQRSDAQQRLAVANHEATKEAGRKATIEALREQVKKHAEFTSLRNTAEKELKRLNDVYLTAQQKAGTKPVEWHTKLTCPHCQGAVMDSEDGNSLVPWQDPPKTKYDAEAAARLPELEKAVTLQQAVLARHEQSVDDAEQAGQQLKVIEDQVITSTDPEPIRGTIETLDQTLAQKKSRQKVLQDAQRLLDQADEKTNAARRHHQDLTEWSAIVDALAPSGVPADLVGAALKPINDRLAQSAVDTGWKQVRIEADMRITADGMPYKLESKSARWRVDAQIAEAVSFLSGLKFMVLDELDILHPDLRSSALKWLDILATEGEVDSCLILGTLRQIPEGLPESYQTVWLKDGRVAVPAAEKVAA